MPRTVRFGNNREIRYVYGADGRKLRSIFRVGSADIANDYCGNVIYESGVAKSLLVDGGYVSLSNGAYHFYLQDHLGNHRVVASSDGAVEEANHYYPFGGTFAGTASTQPYKYNGKELDERNGLNWYDYGARHYDAALGRWHVVDPMAERYYGMSPYIYCLDNPMKYVDPDGRTPAHVVAGIFGGILDYGLQVATNYVKGKSGSGAWTDISPKSIIASAGTSAAGVGLTTKIGQVLKLIKMGKVATTAAKVAKEVAVDATMSTTNQLLSEGTIDAESIVVDVVAGQAVGNTIGAKVKSDALKSHTGKVLQKEADRAQRVASGNAPRESRVQKAKETTKKAERYGDDRVAGTTTVTSGAISGANELRKKILEEQ